MGKKIPSWGKTIIYATIAALAIRLLIPNVPQTAAYL